MRFIELLLWLSAHKSSKRLFALNFSDTINALGSDIKRYLPGGIKELFKQVLASRPLVTLSLDVPGNQQLLEI
jgi:hypothetical protein